MKPEKIVESYTDRFNLIEREQNGTLVVKTRTPRGDIPQRVSITKFGETALLRTHSVNQEDMRYFGYNYKRSNGGEWYWDKLKNKPVLVREFKEISFTDKDNFGGAMLPAPDWANGIYIHLPNSREQQIPEVIPYQFVRYRRLR